MNWATTLLVLIIIVIALWVGLGSLAKPKVQNYSAEKPVLSFKEYFNGPVEAWGIFTDRTGKVQQRFTVHMEGHWVGNEGRLEEEFEYADGNHQHRTWEIKVLGDGRYQATAGDIVGTATGTESGNAVNWNYTLALPLFGSTWHMQFDDWMYLVNGDTLINKASMSKWGIQLGEVTLFFKKSFKDTHVAQSTP